MLYIKSYQLPEGKNFVIKEAIDVQTEAFKISTDKLQEFAKKQELDLYEAFIEYVTSKLHLDGELVYGGYVLSEHQEEYNLLSYFCPECEEKKYFIPDGVTYIVNENGATIATIK